MLNSKLFKCRYVIQISALYMPSFNSLLAFRDRKLYCCYNSSQGKSFVRGDDDDDDLEFLALR
jgi:hypothetical protein